MPSYFVGATGWIAFAAVVGIGLLVLGITDVSRFSLSRAWAISGVSFSESLRRRVLWITPLAMLGVIIISQLQKPIDEQDAIRATTKFAIFATGLVVVLTTIILACTNLPREIENRVIYTIVTKPTTRLEIVLGKIIGFARVSLTILIIMGVFTWIYLSIRAWTMQHYIADRLEKNEVPALSQGTLEHYRDAGLLTSKSIEHPQGLRFYAAVPNPGDDKFWFKGANEQEVSVPFRLEPEMLIPPGGTVEDIGKEPVSIVAFVGYEQYDPNAMSKAGSKSLTGNTPVPYPVPFLVPPEQRGGQHVEHGAATVTLGLVDNNRYGIPNVAIGSGPATVQSADGSVPIEATISPDGVRHLYDAMLKSPDVYFTIQGQTENTRYFVHPNPVQVHVIGVGAVENGEKVANVLTNPPPTPIDPGFTIRGRNGSYGQQLGGGADDRTNGVAIYTFKDVAVRPSELGRVPMELRVGIERSGDDDFAGGEDVPTRLAVTVHNLSDGTISEPVDVIPETLRPTFFTVPASSVTGGNFEVMIRNHTPGHFIGLQDSKEVASLVLVKSRQPFLWNLIKSLFILWLMSILVTAVAIFCSTFLSWPIAVVLTLVILLGHWGVMQLGDATQSGIGNAVVTDLFGSDASNAAKARAVSASVEALANGLRVFSAILPDISQFTALQEIEQGVSIPGTRLMEAAGVTFGFGIPLGVLAYLFLKNKEVAP